MSIQQMLLGAGGLPPTTYDQATFTGHLQGHSEGPTAINYSATGTGVAGGTFSTTNTTSAGRNLMFTWTCPADVTAVDVLCIGAGGGGGGSGELSYYIGPYVGGIDEQYKGGGGGGGALVYKNNIPVSAGTTYYVVVGSGGPGGGASSDGYGDNGRWGGASFFCTGSPTISGAQYQPAGSYIKAEGGNHGQGSTSGGSGGAAYSSGTGFTGHTGYTGGAGATAINGSSGSAGGGGGAAGYAGNGGAGGRKSGNTFYASTAGSGGGGGGGGGRGASGSGTTYMAGGGGVGIYGQGTSGAASGPYNGSMTSTQTLATYGAIGKGGSSGGNSYNHHYPSSSAALYAQNWHGGLYGGGGAGGEWTHGNQNGKWGAPGAVRILWSSDNDARSYPSTNTGNL